MDAFDLPLILCYLQVLQLSNISLYPANGIEWVMIQECLVDGLWEISRNVYMDNVGGIQICSYLSQAKIGLCNMHGIYMNIYGILLFMLQVVENAVFIHKGTNPDIDSYSAFWDNNKLSQTGLIDELTSRGITDVYVCGLAYDICVGKLLVFIIS